MAHGRHGPLPPFHPPHLWSVPVAVPRRCGWGDWGTGSFAALSVASGKTRDELGMMVIDGFFNGD